MRGLSLPYRAAPLQALNSPNAQSAHLQPWMDVSDAAHQTLEKELPKIAAHSAARLLSAAPF